MAPQCSPNRASILTGRYIWQLEEAGTHASNFPAKYITFPDILEKAGYAIGYTGKGWGPGNWKVSGRTRNPAGPEFNDHKVKVTPTRGISHVDYAANFREFLEKKDPDKPFFFWYGGHEPHRSYQKGSGVQAGMDPAKVKIPPFLPDSPVIRGDILDYLYEIEYFDKQLGKMLKLLKQQGELENTLVVVTSDNGMPFPRAKANLYEYGIREPLAVSWPERIKRSRVVDDLISFADFAPTFLEAAGLEKDQQMSGKSFLNVILSDKNGYVDTSRTCILGGRERHTHARPDNLGYPVRAIRTRDFLYIWNVKPDRWPAGDPEGNGKPIEYYDVDASPTKTFMIEYKAEYPELFYLAFDKRAEEELYRVEADPGCMKNLANDPKYQAVKKKLGDTLKVMLKEQGDPRMSGYGDIFESYPRYSPMRNFKGFKERGKYNPAYQKKPEHSDSEQ